MQQKAAPGNISEKCLECYPKPLKPC
uniref:Uncharacterized protein n=1 Tax=Rhizophora mucronata TaxID=61149 RepID=A0A2P2PQC4_RHIMU